MIPLTPGQHYSYTREVRSSIASNRILWRFLTTDYHNLVSELSTSSRATRDPNSFLTTVICEECSDGGEIVKRNVRRWAVEGGKWRGLANDLSGLGLYFFFPPKVSD